MPANLSSSSYKLPVEQYYSNPASFAIAGKYYSVDYASPTAASSATITKTNGAAGSYSGGSDKVACPTCHNPHGSVSTDNVDNDIPPGMLTDPRYANAAGDMSLLRFNNRTVCQSCHAKGKGYSW